MKCQIASAVIIYSALFPAICWAGPAIDRMDPGGGSSVDLNTVDKDFSTSPSQERLGAHTAAKTQPNQAPEKTDQHKQETPQTSQPVFQEPQNRPESADDKKYHERAKERTAAYVKARIQAIRDNPKLTPTQRQERIEYYQAAQHACKTDVNYCVH